MSCKTIVEKIFTAHAGQDLKAGDWCVADMDFYSGTDTKSPKAIEMFCELGMPVHDPTQVAFGMDHYVPCGHPQRANAQKALRDFAEKNGIRLFNPGDGVSIQLFMDDPLVKPGMLAGMAESHCPSLGAANCCCVAIGEAELAAAMATGKLWFKVPHSIKVDLDNTLSPGVYAKDVALALMGLFKTEGAPYQVLEFSGSGMPNLNIDDRVTLCNMVADIGAKTAIAPGDAVTVDYFARRLPGETVTPVNPDAAATYIRRESIDLATLPPLLARPHSVDNIGPVAGSEGEVIHQAIIGSCTNGRLADLRIAASILKRRRIPASVRLFVAPASRQIYLDALEQGIVADLVAAGAIMLPPSCGPCTGFTLQGIPADGDVVISSANRNFKGRMGNKNASIYLASPATVAASALNGRITDPRQYCR